MSLNEPKPKTEAEAYSEYIARSRSSREELPPDAESAEPDAPHHSVHDAQADHSDAPKTDTAARRYRMEGEIARGGMAAILKVWDADLRRTLAMKVILSDKDRTPDGSTADMRLSRFLGEAQITGQLDHPGVVPVHELGLDENGRVYFTMRLVKGDNFGEVIQKVRNGTDGWNLTRAINVLHRVCETMAYAHSKGVVHRDLKPENVMVGRFGETYAMDWGVARLLDNHDAEATRQEVLDSATSSAFIVRRDILTESASRTQAGAIMGTPCYMPPEQAAGEIESIGPQSDVYSVGAILYQLLTGTRPYARAASQSSLAVVRAVLEGPPTPIHKLERKVSPELAAICERAMARAPADRYPSMVQMAADLQAYLEGRVVHAYRTGAVAEFVKWVRRNRGISAALAGLVLVAIVGLVALAWKQGEKASASVVEQNRTRAERDEAVADLEQARKKEYLANVTAAHASLVAGETAEAKRYLADCVGDSRGWEWNHLSLAADASIACFDAQAGPISGLAMDATGDRLVAGVTHGSPRVYDLGARSVAVVLEDDPSDRPLRAPAVAFVDSGLSVAAFGRQDERIRVWNASAGSISDKRDLRTRATHAIAVSPLPYRVALGAADHSICIIDPPTGHELGRLPNHLDTVLAITFSADGSQLISGSADRTVRIWDITSLREIRKIDAACAVHSVAKSREGELAIGLADGSIWRYTADGQKRDQLSGHEGHVYGLAYDHDGTRLASASFDKTVRVWSTADGRQLAVLVGHDQAVTHVQFAAKGSILASGSADGTVRLWDPDRNRAHVVHESRGGLPRAVDITKDGSLVAVGSDRPGTIEVLDAESGMQKLVVSGGPREDAVVALRFAPNGEHLAVAFREEKSLRICDVASGKLGDAMLGQREAALTSIAWSPDGTTIASGSEDRKVRLWDTKKNEAIGTPWEHPAAVTAVTFSADGKRVAAGTRDGSVHVSEVPSGKSLLVIPSDNKAVLALAFAPEGGALAVGYHEGGIRIFAADQKVARLAVGHSITVNALRYLPDGSRLVSGAVDNTVRLWDAATGRLVLSLRDHGRPVTGVAARGSPARVVSASEDGTVRIRNARNVQGSAR
ncbi:MAG TPA: protein kinase [Planctomycetota bacterium]|nr:protein kinase [Planctomycetota bacterium]